MRRAGLNRLLCVIVFTCGFSAGEARAQATSGRFTGPWNLESLKQAPKSTWGKTSGLVTEVYYEGEPFRGKSTRVFAYYARPKEGVGPFPAVVLVHGGGGKAFAEWATLWAERGYVALAMDLAGHGPGKPRLPDGGPEQDDENKFRDFTDAEVDQMWTYHAVADVVRGHSLLAKRPEVDAKRIGITGISWGGYLTCIVAGIDDRLKVAVPVYGCGFLQEDSAWVPILSKMTPRQRDRWVERFDPSKYLPGVSCPILFVNGTNDFAYPLDSYQKSYRLVPGPVDLCVTVRMPHSHPDGWAPREIGLYVDSVLREGRPLARVGALVVDKNHVSASVQAVTRVTKAGLHFTNDGGPWQKRNWSSKDGVFKDGKVEATLPEPRPRVAFVTVTDDRGVVTSSSHIELASP